MAKAEFRGTEDFESGFRVFVVLFHPILKSKKRHVYLTKQACTCPAIEMVVNSVTFHLRGYHFGFVLGERARQLLHNGMVVERPEVEVTVKEEQET